MTTSLILSRLTHSGRVIVLSIHQPRYSIFRQFDSLTLLSQGEIVYHGPALQTLPYFEKLGEMLGDFSVVAIG